ncbi:hypothetical protein ABBQ38_008659 [Trebouxia sp. C0009 RCD-2024]
MQSDINAVNRSYHQYKFIVDGEWRHDETQPFMPDPLGNVNNWLFVRRPEQTSQNQGILSTSSQQLQSPQQQPQPHLQQLTQGSAALQHPSQAQHSQHNLQHAASQQHQQPQHQQSPLAATTSSLSNHSDVDMQNADSTSLSDASNTPMQADEPGYTRKKIKDFLCSHSIYELIPESGKVVLLDIELPVRQAFHALHEQGVAAASLWDAQAAQVAGIISASDFIHILRRLRSSVNSGAHPRTEEEMDQHTIRGLREEAANDGRPFRRLVYVKPEEHLDVLVERLVANEVSSAPCLTTEPDGQEICTLLHVATFGSILACLLRHFRSSLASLPLLSQPVGNLPIGTWSPASRQAQQEEGSMPEGEEGRDRRQIRKMQCVRPSTALTTALGLLLETGVSSLPVTDEKGALLDLYARSDITTLCRGNNYNRLQWEDVTVGQALALTARPASPEPSHHRTPSSPGVALQGVQSVPSISDSPQPDQRLHWCTPRDPLRLIVERLATPSVRRIFVLDPESKVVEGIISLSDLAAYLFQ